MVQSPPATGNPELDAYLQSVKNALDTATKPLAGWKLSDFEANVSEVISDERNLIDIVTAWDDLTQIRDSFATDVASYDALYQDSKILGNQYQDYAEAFSQIMEWWDQNVIFFEAVQPFIAQVASGESTATQAAQDAAQSALEAFGYRNEASLLVAGKADTGFGDVVDTIETGDFNALDLSVAGLYRIKGGTGFVTNMPTTTAGLWWNTVLVSTMDPAGANAKLFFAHSTASATVYCRVKYNTTWGAWTAITTAYSAMTYAVGSAASPTTTGYTISASILQQVLKYFLTGSSTTAPTATGQSLMTATDAADARAKIGAAAVGEGGGTVTAHTHPATDISDSTTVGRGVMTAVDAAAARTAIGAGTSSLTLGTTSSTAKAGDYQPGIADVTGLQTALDGKVSGTGVTAIVKVATMPGSPDPNTLYIVTG